MPVRSTSTRAVDEVREEVEGVDDEEEELDLSGTPAKKIMIF